MRIRIPLRCLTIALAIPALLACAPAKDEPIDVRHIAGRWMLNAGGETEWFHLEESGTFTAEIRGNGFVATTLSQGPRVELNGRWKLDGRTLSFDVDASNDEALVDEPHSYRPSDGVRERERTASFRHNRGGSPCRGCGRSRQTG